MGGRLYHFHEQWCELPDLNLWVLSAVHDVYKITPPHTHTHTSLAKMLLLLPVDQHSLVENMIVKVAIQRVDLDTQKKKNREWRLVFNLKMKTVSKEPTSDWGMGDIHQSERCLTTHSYSQDILEVPALPF